MTSISDRDDLEGRLTVMLRERAAAVEVHSDADTVLAHPINAGGRRSGRRWMLAAAATFIVLAIGLLAVAAIDGSGSVQTDTVAPTPAPSTNTATTALLPADSSAATLPATVTPAPGTVGGSAFAMTSPSALEEAQATDDDLYGDGDVGTQVSAAGNSVSLRTCRDSASAVCGTGWAYVTQPARSGEMHGGLLGDASPDNLRLQLLDDRYFVAWEASAAAQAPSKAWLIDAVSGQAGVLSWHDEPTTLRSPERRLLLCEESYSSFSSGCAVIRGPDATDGGWTFLPTDAGLPKVVDIRDGTIRPLAMPNSVDAGLPVAQHGTGRIWVGTDPDGDRLGLAYSDDGGATWTEVALPEQLRPTSEELMTSLVSYGDDLLEIAADGDRIAVASSWGGDNNTVYVSHDAGRSWSPATSEPGGNGVHLYVLADGRLVVMGSIDPYPSQVLASTGPDWTELGSVDVEFAAEPGSLTDQRFSVNRAGVAMIAAYIDDADSSTLDTIDFSTDLTNWSTIRIRNP